MANSAFQGLIYGIRSQCASLVTSPSPTLVNTPLQFCSLAHLEQKHLEFIWISTPQFTVKPKITKHWPSSQTAINPLRRRWTDKNTSMSSEKCLVKRPWYSIKFFCEVPSDSGRGPYNPPENGNTTLSTQKSRVPAWQQVQFSVYRQHLLHLHSLLQHFCSFSIFQQNHAVCRAIQWHLNLYPRI